MMEKRLDRIIIRRMKRRRRNAAKGALSPSEDDAAHSPARSARISDRKSVQHEAVVVSSSFSSKPHSSSSSSSSSVPRPSSTSGSASSSATPPPLPPLRWASTAAPQSSPRRLPPVGMDRPPLPALGGSDESVLFTRDSFGGERSSPLRREEWQRKERPRSLDPLPQRSGEPESGMSRSGFRSLRRRLHREEVVTRSNRLPGAERLLLGCRLRRLLLLVRLQRAFSGLKSVLKICRFSLKCGAVEANRLFFLWERDSACRSHVRMRDRRGNEKEMS